MTVDVYAQFFSADMTFAETKRRAALVALSSDSERGQIRYTASAAFFPHVDDEDFAVSYDAYFSVIMYEGKGRRSKKREAELMEKLRGTVDSITNAAGGKIDWNSPLRDARIS